MLKVAVLNTHNFGDFLNVMPVLSGLHKTFGPIKLVVSDMLQMINGFREFMEYQGIFSSVHFSMEVIGMRHEEYVQVIYSDYEYRDLTEMPDRPIETMRHERFVRDIYPYLTEQKWKVDDEFVLKVDNLALDPKYIESSGKIICGDRWLHHNTDGRRKSNILKDTGYFEDADKFYFLDYSDSAMLNAFIINQCDTFIGTFTGSSVIADLMNKNHFVLYNDDMVNPPWNNAPIEYSYWKHYYKNRNSELVSCWRFKDIFTI